MRKSLFLVLSLVVFFSLHTPGLQAQTEEIEATVHDYFQHLKSGDTEGIVSLLTDPILSERSELLMRNSEYPEFLRETYKNSWMEITHIRAVRGNKRAVDVEIYFSDHEPPLKTRFILTAVGGSWRISEEISK